MHYIIALLLLLFFGNADYQVLKTTSVNTDVQSQYVDSVAWELLVPYKERLDADMNEVLCYAKTDLKKGQPESLLGNWTSDLCLKIGQNRFKDTIDVVLFNNGGLRYNLSEGDISKREIYQLVPFENELVVLSLTLKDVEGLMNYLKHTGGQPVAFSKWFTTTELPFHVLTTDYLANGGDKMSFFTGKEQISLGIKMRDAIIQHCVDVDSLSSALDNRHLIFMKNE